MTTIRDQVKGIQREVGTGELLPDRGAQLLMMATALVGNVNDEIRAADSDYAFVRLGYLDAGDAATHAKIRAETTTEFARRQEARDTAVLLKELIGSLKYFIRLQTEEIRMTR